MKLSQEQQRAIRDAYDICVNECCDTCKAPLNYLRYTRKDQEGEWCSRVCRDGQEAADRYDATRKGMRIIRPVARCQQCNLTLPSDLRADARFCDAACKKASQRAESAAAA
jgi:hypothetical protein